MTKKKHWRKRTPTDYEIANLNGYEELTALQRFKAIAREASQLLDFLAHNSIRNFELNREKLQFERLNDDEIALYTARELEDQLWHMGRDICLKFRILLKDHNMKPKRRSRI